MLKESLGEEKVEEDIELDVKMDAYIPEDYISSSSSRMDCYKQIAEISTDEDRIRVVNSLEEYYGKIPYEVENLILIAGLKSAARKRGAIKIVVGAKKSYIELRNLQCLQNDGFIDELTAKKNEISLEFAASPVIDFTRSGKNPEEVAEFMLKTLTFQNSR